MNDPKLMQIAPKRTRASGAGVRPDDGVTHLGKQIRIDPASEAILAKIGGGNLSLGIREAARRLAEGGQTGPFSAAKSKLPC